MYTSFLALTVTDVMKSLVPDAVLLPLGIPDTLIHTLAEVYLYTANQIAEHVNTLTVSFSRKDPSSEDKQGH